MWYPCGPDLVSLPGPMRSSESRACGPESNFKPDIVVIFGDDIGYWSFSAYNHGLMDSTHRQHCEKCWLLRLVAPPESIMSISVKAHGPIWLRGTKNGIVPVDRLIQEVMSQEPPKISSARLPDHGQLLCPSRPKGR